MYVINQNQYHTDAFNNTRQRRSSQQEQQEDIFKYEVFTLVIYITEEAEYMQCSCTVRVREV